MARERHTVFPLPPWQEAVLGLGVFPANPCCSLLSGPPWQPGGVLRPICHPWLSSCSPVNKCFPEILPSEMAISGMVLGSAVSFPNKAFFPPPPPHSPPPAPALCQAETHTNCQPRTGCAALWKRREEASFCLPGFKSRRPAVAHTIALLASATS